MDRRAACESRRDLDHCLLDQHGNWIEIAGERVETEALGFEGDCASAAEWIDYRRWPVREAPVDLSASRSQNLAIAEVLPDQQALENSEQPLTFELLFINRQRLIARRVINQ
jgi:hypothetical protein